MADTIQTMQSESLENVSDCEDYEQQGDDFNEEEPTSKEELDKFEKWAKIQGKKSLRKHDEWTNLVEMKDIRDLIMKLNNEQRNLFDDFCERLIDDSDPIYTLLEKQEQESHI